VAKLTSTLNVVDVGSTTGPNYTRAIAIGKTIVKALSLIALACVGIGGAVIALAWLGISTGMGS
jgi:hypothetical protein